MTEPGHNAAVVSIWRQMDERSGRGETTLNGLVYAIGQRRSLKTADLASEQLDCFLREMGNGVYGGDQDSRGQEC